MINSNSLKYFYFTARMGSIRKAADYCNVSQPAVSQALKKLEEELDVNLLIREKNRTVLTNQGRELFEFASDYWEASQKIRDAFRSPKDRHLVLKLGVNKTYVHLFNKLISQFLQNHPQMELHVSVGAGQDIRDEFKMGGFDVVVGINMNPREELKDTLEGLSIYLFDDEVSLYARKNHPLSKKKSLRLKDVSEYGLILPSFYTGPVEEQFLASNLNFNLRMVANHPRFVANVLMQTDFLGALSRASLKKQALDGLVALDIDQFHESFFISAEFQKSSEVLNPVSRNLFWSFLEKNAGLLGRFED